MLKSIVSVILVCCLLPSANASAVFDAEKFTSQDSVLVVESDNTVLYSWQADKALIPASLTKLATAHLAIGKWGLSHRFVTDFYVDQNALWVKGYGDPFLVSEELDSLIAALATKVDLVALRSIHIDNKYFDIAAVPGRSKVADPYNAPLSAVSANFNTANLINNSGVLESAEPQTPITATARTLAKSMRKKRERVNLVNADNAQRNFAELLMAKMAKPHLSVNINQTLPTSAKLIYRHANSRSLADVLRGTLEFSNNFMANHVFLKLADKQPLGAGVVSFNAASSLAKTRLSQEFNWQGHTIGEGSGLSRNNRLSASQIDDLLKSLASHKTLFKKIKTKHPGAFVHAKTGTLDGVRSYAGFIQLNQKTYRFVFIFNRKVPYRFRDQMLERLLQDLSKR